MIGHNINPTELDYDIENRWYDSSNNVSTHVSRVKDSDTWVCYRSWRSGSNETEFVIKDIGWFDVEAVELDVEMIAEELRSESGELAEHYPDLADDLRASADDLAEGLVDNWSRGAEELVGDAAYDGTLSMDGTFAWVSHVEEGISIDVEYALSDVGIDDREGIAQDIAHDALFTAVKEHRDSWRNPHAEYMGRLVFDDCPEWHLRALELEQNSVLQKKWALAQVAALLEAGKSQRAIADELGIAESTTSEHVARLRDLRAKAQWTIEHTEAF